MLCPYRSIGRLETQGHGMPCPKFPTAHLASCHEGAAGDAAA